MLKHVAKLYTNQRGLDMRAKALATAAGSSAVLLCLLASASPAQERTRKSAPIIRVLSENGAGVASSYVRPVIQVAEDSYVFAVMMDLDGHIQVLHPDFPGISVRIRSQKQHRLPNFFAGFNNQRFGGGYANYSNASLNRYSGGPDDTRGTIIALASRVPFNLELIEADGDWNMAAIRRLIEHRTPEGAAQALARSLGAKGERIGRDFMRFAGQEQGYYAYNSFDYYCGYGGFGSAYAGQRILRTYARFNELRAMGLRPVVIGYDQCGAPLIVAAPIRPGAGFRPPVAGQPQDTTVFPKSHFPKGIARRPTPEGVFPLPDRAEQVQRAQLGQRPDLPQIRDVTITAPRGRRTEPREIFQGHRPQPGVTAIPERGPRPVDRAIPSRSEPAATGMRPVYRPEPRVTAPSEPARRPERAPAPAPAPVVHERPAAPSSPPPRAETHSKPEPTTSRPPRT
jgi:hypothetical protein